MGEIGGVWRENAAGFGVPLSFFSPLSDFYSPVHQEGRVESPASRCSIIRCVFFLLPPVKGAET